MTQIPDDDQPIRPDAVTPGGLVPEDSPGAGADGGLGGLNLGGLLEQAAAMQEQMMAAQEQAAAEVVEGAAGGGVVRVRVNGAMQFESVTISPDAVDPSDVEMLQDLVLAALHDAVAQVQEMQAASIGDLGLGGMDLGGLLGGAG